MADLKFNRIWASGQNWAYPTDSQAARGLSFLGTEEPTFDLHDVMFKELHLQDQWLYDQVRNACERFGQKVQNDDGSAMDGARDAMANTITNALITQRKADEGGYGIVKMANADTVRAGKEYNQAVSPAHLAEYMAEQNTWQNTRDKPQTATRWPSYSEVTNTPNFGAAAFKGVFDTPDWKSVPWNGDALVTASTARAITDQIEIDKKDIYDIKSGLGSMASQNANAVDISGGEATLERLNLSGGGRIFSDGSKGTIGIVNDAGDTLYLEPSNGLTYVSNDGVRHMRWEYGKLVVGEVPSERISGLGSAASKDESYFDKSGTAKSLIDSLPSMAHQNANAVSITGGSVTVDDMLGFKTGARLFHDQSTDAVGIKTASGDALYIEKDGKLTFATADGVVRNQWHWGDQIVGEIDKSHIKNLGDMAGQNSSDVNITGGTATLDRVTLPGGGYLFSNKDTGTIGIKNASGDTLYIEPNNGFTFTSNEGTRRMRWEYGRLVNGIIPVDRIEGLGSAATTSANDYDAAGTARSLVGNGDLNDIGYAMTPINVGGEIRYLYTQWIWWNGTTSSQGVSGVYEGSSTFTWKTAFPNKCLMIIPSINDVSGDGLQEQCWAGARTATQGTVQFSCKRASTFVSGWCMAIGY